MKSSIKSILYKLNKTNYSTKMLGDIAENVALARLEKAGLQLVERNYKTPGRGGGEIDLIMSQKDGTLVFVEVRQRCNIIYGGASYSVSLGKRNRILLAANYYLAQLSNLPKCRFDVVLFDGSFDSDNDTPKMHWIKAAFDDCG